MMAIRDVLGGVPLWCTLQGELDAERLHHAQAVATLTGERDAARRECAELRATVAGQAALIAQLVEDRQFYMAAFCDEFKAHQEGKQKDGLLTRPSTLTATRLDMPDHTGHNLAEPHQTLPNHAKKHECA
jgi:hypothetical protein